MVEFSVSAYGTKFQLITFREVFVMTSEAKPQSAIFWDVGSLYTSNRGSISRSASLSDVWKDILFECQYDTVTYLHYEQENEK